MKTIREAAILAVTALLVLSGCSGDDEEEPIVISLSDLTVEQQDAALLAWAEGMVSLLEADNAGVSGLTAEEALEKYSAESKSATINNLINTCNRITESSVEDLGAYVEFSDLSFQVADLMKTGALDETVAVHHFCPYNNEKLRELLNLL